MQTHKYEDVGRQEPVFFDPDLGAARFVIEADDADSVRVEVTYDPMQTRRTETVWEPFDGGWAGWLPGPPTAIRVTVKQAKGPVFFNVEQERESK